VDLGLLNKCRQRLLTWASARQFLQPSFLATSPTPSIHLDFGRPGPRWPPGSVHNIFLGNSFSSIRTTFVTHLSRLDFITLTVFGSLYSSYDPLLHLFRHCPSFMILIRNSWLYNTVPLHLIAAVHWVREAHTLLPQTCQEFHTHIDRAWGAGIA